MKRPGVIKSTFFIASLAFATLPCNTRAGGCVSSNFTYDVESINFCTNTVCIIVKGYATGLHGDETFCWDWGDGSPPSCETPGLTGDQWYTKSGCHGYPTSGTFMLSLNVTPAHTSCLIIKQITFGDFSFNTNLSCAGMNDGCVHYEYTPNHSGITYNWSNGSSGSDVCGLSPGTYTVTIMDSNGCTITDQVTVGEPDPLVTNVDSYDCSTGDAFITVTGGSPYSQDPTPFDENFDNIGGGVTQGGNPIVWTSDNGNSGGGGFYTYWETIEPGNYWYGQNMVNEAVWTTQCIDISNCANINLSLDVMSDCVDDNDYFQVYYTIDGGAEQLLMNRGIDLDPPGQWFYLTSPINGSGNCLRIIIKARTPTGGDNSIGDCTGSGSGSSSSSSSSTTTSSGGSSTSSGGGGNSDEYGNFSFDNVLLSCNIRTTDDYSFMWCNGETSEDITNLPSSGCCAVTITDGQGCTSQEEICCCNLELLTSYTDVTCNGACDGTGTINITNGVAPYIYVWSNGGNGSTETGLCAGTYTVTTTGSDGCEVIEIIVISEPPPLTISTTPTNILCAGDATGSIIVTVSGGTPGYTYTWSNGGNGTTITGLTPGTYTVTATDLNGCSITVNETITEPPPIVLTPGSADATCGVPDGTVSVTATGGISPYTYNWSAPGGNTTGMTGLSGGTYTVTVTDANGCTEIITANVNESGAPTTSVTGINPLCAGDNDGSIDLTVMGGLQPYIIGWDNGSSTEDLTGLSPGTYNVTVTSSDGCITTNTFTITEPPPVVISTVPTHILCAGDGNGAVNLTVSGGIPGYTFRWDNGPTTEDISGLNGGQYCVTVTDANGCTETTCETVNEPPPLTINVGPDQAMCPDNTSSVTLTISAGGGTPSYTYIWSSGGTGTSETVSPTITTTYTVTVTDANGCTITDNIVVIVACTPTVFLSPDAFCVGGCASLEAIPVLGQVPYSYQWNPNVGAGPGPHSVCPTTSTTYSVTLTDANGDTASATTTVTVYEPPGLTTSQQDATCGACDGSVSVTVTGEAPFIYNWDNGCSTASCTSLCPGTYNVTVTSAQGCVSTATEVINNVGAPSITASATDALCAGACDGTTALTITTQGTPPYTYLWDNGCSDVNCTGVCAGDYSITITDAVGCIAVANTTVNEPPPLTITLTKVDEICGNCQGSASVSVSGGTPGSPPYTFNWDNGMTVTSIFDLCSGIYALKVTDGNGCAITGSTTVDDIQILPDANFIANPIEVTVFNPTVNFIDKSIDAISWYWTFGDTTTSTMQHPTHTYQDTGCFPVMLAVENQYGCVDTTYGQICVRDITSIYVPNAFSPNGDGKNEWFTVGEYNYCEFEMYIFDRWGNLIYQTTNLKGWDGTANGGIDIIQEDVYVWLVKAVDCYGKVWKRIGHVTVVR